MAEPVSTILALRKLATNLVTSIKDGKDADRAKEILSLVNELQQEFFALQQQIIKVETANVQLKQQAAKNNEPIDDDVAQPAPDKLDEASIRILQYMAKFDGRGHTAASFAQALNLSLTKAKHFADKLDTDWYISSWDTEDGRTKGYRIAAKGREYLVSNNLVI